jgi:hypothetical protein
MSNAEDQMSKQCQKAEARRLFRHSSLFIRPSFDIRHSAFPLSAENLLGRGRGAVKRRRNKRQLQLEKTRIECLTIR